ncbi:hypothetical protein MMC32_000073 [Xylographa parallela]|nr:hypothetical protein [Xylographa parallela]
MPTGGVIMTPCSENTWGCALECGTNTFHVSTGTLQISEANYAELEIDNGTANSASSTSASTPTPAAATMSVITEPANPGPTACAITSPPKSNINIVGIGVGVPLGLAFAITALLFLNERRKLLKLRRARVLFHDRKPAQTVYQASDPAKLQYSQSYRSQLPYQQSYQPPSSGPLSDDSFPETGGSPGLGEKPSEKKMLQELP